MTEPPDPERLAQLLPWLEAWSAAHQSYFRWIAAEFARRRAAHEADRRRARTAIVVQASRLPMDRGGRIVPGRSRAKRLFRARMDTLLMAVVRRGQKRYGIEGEWNRAGLFIGVGTPELTAAARRALVAAFNSGRQATDDRRQT